MGENVKTIIFYGRKQSGKSTAASAIYAYYLTQNGIIPNATLLDDGTIRIIYSEENKTGFDFKIDNIEQDNLMFVSEYFWPYVYHASFADNLKLSVNKLFGIDLNLMNGSDEDKNQLTHIKWSGFIKLSSDTKKYAKAKGIDPESFMTIREVLQRFGTDICRTIDEDVHLKNAWNELQNADPIIGIIPDGRFENEFTFFDQFKNDNEIYRIKFTRDISGQDIPGEQALPGIPDDQYDLVVDNQNISVHEKNQIVVDYLINAGVLNKKDIIVENNNAVPVPA